MLERENTNPSEISESSDTNSSEDKSRYGNFTGVETLIKHTQEQRGTFETQAPPIASGGTTTTVRHLENPGEYRKDWDKIGADVYIDAAYEKLRLIFVGILIVPVLYLSYFTAVGDIVTTWWRVQDYTHGFVIIPLVVYFLWIRFDTYPGTEKKLCWLGLLPMLFSCCARYFGSLLYMDAVEQWSILFWILGVVWFFYGTKVFIWALPSLSFLCFMFPLPYSYEVRMRQELQLIAAKFAAFILQVLGQPAVNIRTTIYMGTNAIGVEGACSGIRFLISFYAIAIGTILLLRRPWYQNLILLLAVFPIALFVNACRISLTAIMIMYFSTWLQSIAKVNQSVGAVADKISGYVTIGFAFVVFAIFMFYLTRVFRKVNVLSSK
ncbi:MAG: exosortase/archaeosortase family protein [Thermoguttaceae bacterium]